MEISEWIKQYAEAQKAEHGTYEEFGATYIGPDLRGTPEHKSFRQLIGILPAAMQKEIINMTRWDKVPPRTTASSACIKALLTFSANSQIIREINLMAISRAIPNINPADGAYCATQPPSML